MLSGSWGNCAIIDLSTLCWGGTPETLCFEQKLQEIRVSSQREGHGCGFLQTCCVSMKTDLLFRDFIPSMLNIDVTLKVNHWKCCLLLNSKPIAIWLLDPSLPISYSLTLPNKSYNQGRKLQSPFTKAFFKEMKMSIWGKIGLRSWLQIIWFLHVVG